MFISKCTQQKKLGCIDVVQKAVLFDSAIAVVNRMMVERTYRSKIHGTGQKLMDAGHQWALEQNRSEIYLGTMAQFKAAQKFYEKNGYTAIEKSELPADYQSNPMDTLYYKLIIKT